MLSVKQIIAARHFRITFLMTFGLLNACTAPKYVSTIESHNYEEKTDRTLYSKLPLGTMSLPGKWIKVRYNDVSGQNGFTNADTVSAALAINEASSYPFYKRTMTSNQFVMAMYEWDSKYHATRTQAQTPMLKLDTTNHFLIWQISANNQYKIDNYYLFGCENGIVFSVFVDTKKWDPEKKMNFLETVYKTKTVGNCCQ